MLSGRGAVAVGDQNTAAGDGAVAIGDPNHATGTGATAIGADNTANGNGAVAIGQQNTATGHAAVALGSNTSATQEGAVSIGNGANASGSNTVALGSGSTASGPGSAAVGQGATATGMNATAIGAGATVENQSHSTAVGANAKATANNQIVLGTQSDTITAPGMNSPTSRVRQQGLLGVVTSDAYGNLASDNGALYEELATVKSGVAMSMALGDPIIPGDDRFAVKLNTAAFDGAYGVGITAAGVVYSKDYRVIVSGGAAWAEADTFGYSRSLGSGRMSMQVSW